MKKFLTATLCLVVILIAVALFANEAQAEKKQVEVEVFSDINGVRAEPRIKKIIGETTEVEIASDEESFIYRDYTDEDGVLVQEIHQNGNLVVSIKRRILD